MELKDGKVYDLSEYEDLIELILNGIERARNIFMVC